MEKVDESVNPTNKVGFELLNTFSFFKKRENRKKNQSPTFLYFMLNKMLILPV